MTKRMYEHSYYNTKSYKEEIETLKNQISDLNKKVEYLMTNPKTSLN